MAFEDASKVAGIEFGFLHEGGKALPVFVATRLHHDRGEMLGAQDAGEGLRVGHFAGFGESFFEEGVVGGEELDGMPFTRGHPPSSSHPRAFSES